MPWTVIDTTVSEDLTIAIELQLAFHEAVRELAGLDRKWTHVARYLLVVSAAALAENDLEYAASGFIRRARNQRDKVRRNGDGNRRGRRH